MECVVLCAGFATRMHPLTLATPKHLLPVADRPVLDYVIERLAAAGVPRAVLVTNQTFADAFETWAARHVSPVRLDVIDDGATSNETRLGSIGDLKFALDQADIRDDFLVVNGDNVFTFALTPVLDTFRQRGSTIVLYDVGSKKEAAKMGVPTCDADGRVIGFREKPADPSTTLISVGIYAFEAKVRQLVDRYLEQRFSPDTTGGFIEWLYEQTPVYAHVTRPGEGLWFDIGSHEQYEAASAQLRSRG